MFVLVHPLFRGTLYYHSLSTCAFALSQPLPACAFAQLTAWYRRVHVNISFLCPRFCGGEPFGVILYESAFQVVASILVDSCILIGF